MAEPLPRWGLTATIKAEADQILRFAAYHLERGAHRLYLYLDAPCPDAMPFLKAHPKIRVRVCNDGYWRRHGGRRPAKHQLRQTANATHAYARKPEVDWLIHMDVDEFLWSEQEIATALGALPDDALCARVRPVEALNADADLFKGFLPAGPLREATVARLYPTFGAYVPGGFLSHLGGKLFVRTGLGPLTVKIHNVFQDAVMNPGESPLPGIDLCHCHATSWAQWSASYRYRVTQGSYRAELGRGTGGLTLHELLMGIEAEAGEPGLRAFYDEICADTPRLRTALQADGLLRHCPRDLDGALARHFPEFAGTVS